jgi:hypothetical protein
MNGSLPPDADVGKYVVTLQHGSDAEAAAAIAAWPVHVTDDVTDDVKTMLLYYTQFALRRSPLSAKVLHALIQAGYTPTQLLWEAAYGCCELPTFQALLPVDTFGAAVNCGSVSAYRGKESILHRILNRFETEQGADLVELLVRHGAPIDAKNASGETVLDNVRTYYHGKGIIHPRVHALLAGAAP